jgi:hypothetical protein
MAEQWLSIVEYARATGISDMTIRRRIRCGRIKAELREGKYFIPIAMENAVNDGRNIPASVAANNAQVMKNRPINAANHEQAYQQRSIPTIHRAPVERPVVERPVVARHVSNQFRDVPETLARPLVDAGLASVEARALIEFCDHALEQARSTVAAVEHKFSARVESLNAQLSNKNQEIKALNQQIEDLQLLVQILERKKIG